MKLQLQNSASIKPRTDLPKLGLPAYHRLLSPLAQIYFFFYAYVVRPNLQLAAHLAERAGQEVGPCAIAARRILVRIINESARSRSRLEAL